jgi:PAS domain S-box-containing protein
MSPYSTSRGRLLQYLIPTLIGLGGLLFSRQIDNAILRFAVILVSVAVPLFAGGNLLARYGGQGRARFLLLGGIVMLLIGAAASLSDVAETMAEQQMIPYSIADISRWLGMFSLVLGSCTVLFSVARTGEAIEEVGERFRHLADLMSEGFVLSSPNGTVVLVNPRFLDMLGLTEEMVVGENAGELVARLGVDSVGTHLDMRAKALASEYEISWHVRGEERQFWLSGTPIFDRHNRLMGTLATVRDVTERNRMAKRLERYAKGLQDLVEEQTQKLRQSEAEFHDLLMQMNEGFITIDTNYRIQFANQRICELLKVSPRAFRGCEVFDFVDSASRMRLMDLLRIGDSPLFPSRPHPELNFVRTDGVAVPVVVAVAPVQAAEHPPAPPSEGNGAGASPSKGDFCYSLVITDVSELKGMQRQLEMRASELEAVNEELRAFGRAKDSFLSNVSHEIKTPLSTINGYVEILTSGSLGSLQVPQVSALKVMERNVKRLVSLINEMIEFSRMEIRGIQLQKTLFSPGKLARECVASAEPQALAKDISLSIFIPDEFPPAWGDPEKISQVLGIVLSNAVKFSNQGGMIQVHISASSEHTLAIAVSDTGIGIGPAFHTRVFEKFFQVDGSMTRRYEGTGIGLSIAKSIVEAHGGEIKIESELNKGSTFTTLFPGAVFDSTVSSRTAALCRDLRVLVVAEGETLRATLGAVLTKSGCAVEEAGNAYECLRLAEETQPNVIVFNELLADAAGAHTMGQLRHHPATSSIPVIGLTGEESSKAQGIAELLHEVHFVMKPFSGEDLMSNIRRVCHGEGIPTGARVADVSQQKPRVLIVDPDPDLSEWLTTALELRGISCYAARDVKEGIEYARRAPPDVILFDADAPALNPQRGPALFRENESTREAPICIMTGSIPEESAAWEGVTARLRKPFSADELMRVIDELRATPVV